MAGNGINGRKRQDREQRSQELLAVINGKRGPGRPTKEELEAVDKAREEYIELNGHPPDATGSKRRARRVKPAFEKPGEPIVTKLVPHIEMDFKEAFLLKALKGYVTSHMLHDGSPFTNLVSIDPAKSNNDGVKFNACLTDDEDTVTAKLKLRGEHIKDALQLYLNETMFKKSGVMHTVTSINFSVPDEDILCRIKLAQNIELEQPDA